MPPTPHSHPVAHALVPSRPPTARRALEVALVILGLSALVAVPALASVNEDQPTSTVAAGTAQAPVTTVTTEAAPVEPSTTTTTLTQEEADFIAFMSASDAQRAALVEAATPKPAPSVPSAPVGGEGVPTAYLACVRQHESGGDYQVISANGLWHGAYQFTLQTWNVTAQRAGRDDLVGVDPAQASPADQDAMALVLYEWQGGTPWAGGRHPC